MKPELRASAMLIVLLAPYFARSGSVREMMHQAAVVGWFALVLGVAFLVQYGLRQRAARRDREPARRWLRQHRAQPGVVDLQQRPGHRPRPQWRLKIAIRLG